MLNKYSKTLKKVGLVLGSVFVLILSFLLLIPLMFEKQVNEKIKILINQNIEGNLDYSKVNLSFFEHFPSLTASLHDIHLKGAKPYQDSTLLRANQISFGLNLKSLISSQVIVDEIIVSKGEVNLLVDNQGHANYLIYKSKDTATSTETDSSSSSLAFRRIRLIDTDFNYIDHSIPMEIKAIGLDYDGKGDFNSNVFDLHTKANIKQFSFNFNKEQYLYNKTISADLITQINTDNLGFVFERNDLKINQLPVRFKGRFAFLPNGYHIDFKLKSQESTLAELLSLVPKSYADWLKNMKIKGTSEVFMNLEGDYIVEQNKNPDLTLGLVINDGFLAYKDAKVPLENLNTKIRLDLPGLNPDSLSIDLKQFEFNIAEGFFKSKSKVSGFNPIEIHSEINSQLDLGALADAIQWPDFDFDGKWSLDAKINGKYLVEEKTFGMINKKEKLITSIPTFEVNNSLENGYFKFAELKSPIDKIEYLLEAKATKPRLNNVEVSLKNMDIKALQNFINGSATFYNLEKSSVDAKVKALVDLSTIKSFYPIDSFDIAGVVNANLVAKGSLDLAKKKFPETNTKIVMKNGYIKSWAYPIPLENIQVDAEIKSTSASMKDLSVHILPISFTVSGEPFMLKADLNNFNDLKYAVKSKGKLQLEPIYKIFAIDGLNVKGFVKTNLDMAGLQSDALNGNYEKLKNRGKVEIGDIYIKSDLLPQPVLLNKGVFTFDKEKLKFDEVTAKYQNNTLVIKGFVDNIINYLTQSSSVLEGKFEMYSPAVKVDDFMAFSSENTSSSSASGVVLLPENLNVEILAKADKVNYDQMQLKNFEGNLGLKNGILSLQNTSFELAGLNAKMQGEYKPLSPRRAKFDYSIDAKDFDIQRAYHEIPMFKEMVSSAKDAHGKVSLNYELAGFLNDKMEPIMPSIEGKGTLTLKDIQFKGFKLLNNIGKAAGKDSFKDGSVKDVEIKTSIKNNVMTIERTKMKMAGFRPRFEGQVTLDGKMNLGVRLGLPPLGIIGIPMRITGTSENFDIKLGKFKEDDLETEEEEDL